jgi:hypothetical protein
MDSDVKKDRRTAHKVLKREVYLPWQMIESEPFNKLSASEMRTYFRCFQKRTWADTRVNGRKKRIYNEEFIFPYAEARAALGIGTTQFFNNMKKLIDLGFIELLHQGGSYRKGQDGDKDYSKYKLSKMWMNYGREGFKIKPKEPMRDRTFYIRENIRRKNLRVHSENCRDTLQKTEVIAPKAHTTRLQKSECTHEAQKVRKGTGRQE